MFIRLWRLPGSCCFVFIHFLGLFVESDGILQQCISFERNLCYFLLSLLEPRLGRHDLKYASCNFSHYWSFASGMS